MALSDGFSSQGKLLWIDHLRCMSKMNDIPAHHRDGQLNRLMAAVNQLKIQFFAGCQTLAPVGQK
jgi:hypothetical protein